MSDMLNLDSPPINDPITEERLTSLWYSWFSTFTQTVSTYLNATGVKFPVLTQAEINGLINVPSGFNVINSGNGTTDLQTVQVRMNGVWNQYTTTPL